MGSLLSTFTSSFCILLPVNLTAFWRLNWDMSIGVGYIPFRSRCPLSWIGLEKLGPEAQLNPGHAGVIFRAGYFLESRFYKHENRRALSYFKVCRSTHRWISAKHVERIPDSCSCRKSPPSSTVPCLTMHRRQGAFQHIIQVNRFRSELRERFLETE